jgi:hypothetical protein
MYYNLVRFGANVCIANKELCNFAKITRLLGPKEAFSIRRCNKIGVTRAKW